MENTINQPIEIKQAWVVTHEGIKEVTAFTIETTGSYGGTVPKTFYSTPKAWKEHSIYDCGIAYSEEDARTLQIVKIKEQLKYLTSSKDDYANKIAEKEEQLKALAQ